MGVGTGLRGGVRPGLGSLEGPGLGSLEGPELSLSAEGTECGASACTDYPSPLMVGFAQLILQVLPRMRKAVPVSCLLHSRLAAARSRAKDVVSPEKAPHPGQAGKGWGWGRGREGGGDEQIQTAACPSPCPQGQGSRLCLYMGQLDVTRHF